MTKRSRRGSALTPWGWALLAFGLATVGVTIAATLADIERLHY